jgi:uncharacterized membrane protein
MIEILKGSTGKAGTRIEALLAALSFIGVACGIGLICVAYFYHLLGAL